MLQQVVGEIHLITIWRDMYCFWVRFEFGLLYLLCAGIVIEGRFIFSKVGKLIKQRVNGFGMGRVRLFMWAL